MREKTSQIRKQRTARKTQRPRKRRLRQKRIPTRSKKNPGKKTPRHRKQPGAVSSGSVKELQNREGDPEQSLGPNVVEESRPIPKQIRDEVRSSGRELSRIFRELEVWSLNPDLGVSRAAFEALAAMLQELIRWLWMAALFPDASLAMLESELPGEQGRERYRRGEHVSAWAGIELARLYKRIKVELGSRSSQSINRIRDLQSGFRLTNKHFAPNQWFSTEYNSNVDYRPTGEMAVWMARKVEELRRLKECRVLWWPISAAATQLESNTETILPPLFRTPDMVKGKTALEQLDNLPPFGDSDSGSFEAWRKFLRRQLLTQTDVIEEFERVFPHARKKIDGVIASTLRYAWQAVEAGGQVFFPALSGPCK